MYIYVYVYDAWTVVVIYLFLCFVLFPFFLAYGFCVNVPYNLYHVSRIIVGKKI